MSYIRVDSSMNFNHLWTVGACFECANFLCLIITVGSSMNLSHLRTVGACCDCTNYLSLIISVDSSMNLSHMWTLGVCCECTNFFHLPLALDWTICPIEVMVVTAACCMQLATVRQRAVKVKVYAATYGALRRQASYDTRTACALHCADILE
ncbi:hypothetical protein J6590_043048, partial [Homalodisca vitripennis]